MATELEDLEILKIVEEIADGIWREVSLWDEFSRNVVGRQITRAADSIGANIAESYGRFHYGDKLLFLYYARGSLFETKYWVNRSFRRDLMSNQQAQHYSQKFSTAARQINHFARGLKTQKQVSNKKILRESEAIYLSNTQNELFSQSDLDWLLLHDPINLVQSPNSSPRSPVSSLQPPFSGKPS